MIVIFDAAKEQINTLTKDSSKKVRIIVNSGGCSGFSYKFDITDQINEDDIILDNFIIDQISAEVLGNFSIDYIDDLSGSYFKVDIEKAKSRCGCGTSFSI